MTTASCGLLAWSLVQFGALVLGLGRFRPLTPSFRAAFTMGVPLAFFVFLALSGESLAWSSFLAHDGLKRAIRCDMFSMMAGISAALAVMWVWRRSDPFHPSFSGSVAGLVGGLGGAIAAGMVCRDHATWHLWLGHGLAIVVLVAFGHLVGRRWLAP